MRAAAAAAAQNLRVTMRAFPWVPVVFTTATTGQRVQQILDAACKARADPPSPTERAPLPRPRRRRVTWESWRRAGATT